MGRYSLKSARTSLQIATLKTAVIRFCAVRTNQSHVLTLTGSTLFTSPLKITLVDLNLILLILKDI